MRKPTPAPRRSVLLNPGPVLVDESVRAAMSYADVCHREPEIADLFDAVSSKIVEVCGADTEHAAVVLAGSGTAALEAAISSVVPPLGSVLVLENGRYGARMREIAAIHRILHSSLNPGLAQPLDLAALDSALANDQSVSHVAMVHHETATGMLNPVGDVGEIVARHARSLIVDAISSLGSEPLDVRLDHVDWCVGTANKNLEGLPGVSFVCASRRALDALDANQPRTYYLDLHAHYVAQVVHRAPLFTPAVQVLFAFDRALDLLLEETPARRAERYGALAARLRDGLRERGIALLLKPQLRANALSVAYLPADMSYDELHDGLKRQGFVIYAAPPELGPVFRVATMGQLTAQDVERFFVALDRLLVAPSSAVEVPR
jgi:2-aminoethylphosphonate-pyruvate transaminase